MSKENETLDKAQNGNDFITDVMAMLPTESQLEEIAFKKYGNDPNGYIKFNLIKRMAFIEGCEFMLRTINNNCP